MTLEAGFCIFLFIVFVAVAVCALYRRAMQVDPQPVPFHYEPMTRDDIMALADLPEIAQPLPKGWQGWEGGECPVPACIQVKVMHRNGVISAICLAEELRWQHAKIYGFDLDIVAWRVAG